jgi:UDP-glucose 4-epimerase
MKMLVTGAGGFVGKRLVRYLADAGHDVTAVVRAEPAAADAPYFASPRLTVLRLDLARLDAGQLPRGIDAVYSLAQSSNFRSFPERADDIFAVNVAANATLLQWAVAQKVERFIYASSGGIYGGRSQGPSHESDLLAVDSPLGFYLGSKLCSEIVIQNFRQLFEGVVILRPFFIYGPRQQTHMFVARMIDSVRTGRPVRLQGPDGLRTNPIYVRDAVQAFAGAIALKGTHVINVAGRDVVSLRHMCESIGAEVGRAPVFEMVAGAPVDYVADTAQAEKKLGLALTPFLSGLRATLGVDPHA